LEKINLFLNKISSKWLKAEKQRKEMIRKMFGNEIENTTDIAFIFENLCLVIGGRILCFSQSKFY
jgi:hypothetical protein